MEYVDYVTHESMKHQENCRQTVPVGADLVFSSVPCNIACCFTFSTENMFPLLMLNLRSARQRL